MHLRAYRSLERRRTRNWVALEIFSCRREAGGTGVVDLSKLVLRVSGIQPGCARLQIYPSRRCVLAIELETITARSPRVLDRQRASLGDSNLYIFVFVVEGRSVYAQATIAGNVLCPHLVIVDLLGSDCIGWCEGWRGIPARLEA